MKIKKFIFLSTAKTHQSMVKRFYLDVLHESGVDVEYWDCRGLFFDENLPYEFPFIHKIRSFKELRSKVSSLDKKNTLINLQISYEFKYLQIYFYFRNFRQSFYFIGDYSYESGAKAQTFGVKLKKILSKRFFEKLGEILFKKLFLQPFHICFHTGEFLERSVVAKKYLPMNYIDCEEQKITKPLKTEDKYVVFLDQNLHAHPDLKELGIDYINKEDYLKGLKRLFKSIEDNLGFKVFIALHPTSSFLDGFLKERQFKNRTASLVAGCEFALTHYSTAFVQVVAAQKPIYFIKPQELLSTYPYAYHCVEQLGELLKTKVFDLRDEIKSTPKVNKEAYEEFLLKHYISHKTKNSFAKEYFVEYFRGK